MLIQIPEGLIAATKGHDITVTTATEGAVAVAVARFSPPPEGDNYADYSYHNPRASMGLSEHLPNLPSPHYLGPTMSSIAVHASLEHADPAKGDEMFAVVKIAKTLGLQYKEAAAWPYLYSAGEPIVDMLQLRSRPP